MGRKRISKGWCCQKDRCAKLSSVIPGTASFQFTTTMERNFVEIGLEDHQVRCLVDSGASFSCISQHQLYRLNTTTAIQRSTINSAIGVCGEVHAIIGEIVLQLSFGQYKINQKFRIFETLHAKAILGLDFLRDNKVKTDFENMTLTIPTQKNTAMNIEHQNSVAHVTIATFQDNSAVIALAETVNTVILEPQSETIIPVKIPKFHMGSTVILEPCHKLQSRFSIAGGKTVSIIDDNNMGIYRLLNPTNQTIYLDSKLQIAVAQLVDFRNINAFKEQDEGFLCSVLESEKYSNNNSDDILADLGINLSDTDLSLNQQQKLYRFLSRNRDIFAKDLSELGKTEMHYHTIHTKGDKVVSLAPYRQSPQMRAEIERQLDEMERHGIIEESTSPFHSPVVLVKKQNGEFRFCVDFRVLNKITEPLSFGIPHMSDILDTLADAKPELYSTIDLRSGFWQVPLDPATKYKSAFITHKGVYEFNRLAFGMANYYRKFVKDYACIATPLTSLLKKNIKFNWTLECQRAFDTLKNALISAPILVFPEFDKPFILSTDASEYSMGYVLSQIQNGVEHSIAYGGRSLRGSELRWHITEKEALALVDGIQHFKHYLANQEFTVYTDNVSVKYLQKIKDCQGRLGRWSLLLQGYNFKIIHREGSKNTADCLSRQQYTNSTAQDSTDLAEHLYNINEKEYTETVFFYKGESEENVIANIQETEIQEPELINLSKHQKECRDFAEIYRYKFNRELPDDAILARTIVAESYNFELEDGILKHFYSKRCKQVPRHERLVKQIAVPRILRDDVLRSYHDCILGGGHQGFDRTYSSLRNKYFWPSMYEDIKQYVKTCEVCQQSKRNYGAKRPPLKPQISDDIFSRWHMDILSGLPTTPDKYKHVLLVVDSYSKWSEIFPLKTQEAGEVAGILYREIITRYGAPRVLISDRGRNFTSNLVKALSEMFQITRHLTSSYHPQTNGSVERMNSVILQSIRSYAKDQQDDWVHLLPGIMMAYRATPATQSTDFSPFFLLFGREMCLPIDTSLIPKEHLAQDHRIFLGRILQNLERTRKIASENIEVAQERNKRQYDKTAQEPEFRPTQRVWLYCTKVPVGKAPKLHRKWVGPYYITLVNRSNHTYRIRNCANNKEVKSLVTAHRLKPYYDPNTRPTNPPQEHENDEEELDPDEIGRQDNNDGQQQNRRQQNGDNNDRQQQNRGQQNGDNNDRQQQNRGQQNDNNNDRQQPNRDQRIGNNNQNQPRNPPVGNTKPSCQDCKRGNCTPFREENIDRLMASNRGNGTLYYKIKFKTGQTEWHFPCKIPTNIVRQFHADRTMSGKKRKRPLNQTKHKFFNKSDNLGNEENNKTSDNSQKESVNVLSTNNNPSLNIHNLKNYWQCRWHSITSVRNHAHNFLKYFTTIFEERLLQEKLSYLKEKHQGTLKQDFSSCGQGYELHEARVDNSGKMEFLLSWMNPNMPPEWQTFDEVPNGCIDTFLKELTREFQSEINPW
ncbi:unnamed protein product [Mytilus edulis]|uniref:Integrase catalytic domain-containing protein n=1 Tax=Mytilus edulis TaxID=6550 RepID=A0A8S3VD18_MYTED|nr:unnamed protein product [Mytilus edulis]